MIFRKSRLRGFLLIALLTPLLSGCIYSREIAHTRRQIEREWPGAEFERRIVLSLGPASIQLARWITGLVDDPDARNAAHYLRDVRRVKVGVYRTKTLPDISGSRVPLRMRRALNRDGWELATKVIDEDNVVWVFYKERRGTVRDLFVVVVNEEDMVLARVKGRLDRIVEHALEDYAPEDWAQFSQVDP